MLVTHNRSVARRGVWALLIVALLVAPVAMAQGSTFDVPQAKSALLMAAETGQVLFAKNVDQPLPPASLVKMMTLLLTFEAIERGEVRLDEQVRVSRHAASVSGSKVWLAEGDRLTVEQLMAAVAIQSANDASIVLAERVAGSEEAFVTRMNEKARMLGLQETHFSNSHGLPTIIAGDRPGVMSARDAATIGRELVTRFPKVLEWTKLWNKPLGPGTRNPIVLENTNRLVLTSSLPIDGLKTGHTSEAGYQLVATAEQDGLRLISVVMGTETATAREEATERLLSYGFNAFDRVVVGDGETFSTRIPDASADSQVRTAKPITVLVPRTQVAQLATYVELDPDVRAPVEDGQRVGELVIRINDEEAMRVPVYSDGDVAQAGFFRRQWMAFTEWLGSLFSGDN